MDYQRLFLGYFVVLGLLSACATNAAHFSGTNPFEKSLNVSIPEKEKLSIVFSGNVQGYVGPCGCAFNPKGGLDRRFEFLKAHQYLNSGTALVVDSGNALFPNLNLDEGQAAALKEKAALILKAHAKMGLVASNVGQLDLAAGVDFLQSAAPKNLSLISTNLRGSKGEKIFQTKKSVEVNGTKVVFLGLSEGAPELAAHIKAADPVAAVKEELSSLPKDAAVVILSDMSVQKNEELAQAISRPLLILGARDLSSLELPLHHEESLELRSQIQGQQWAVVDFAWKAKAESWFSPEVGQKFKARWETLSQEEKELKARRPANDDVKRELKSLGQVAEDMEQYTLKDAKHAVVYSYKLYDLGETYAQKNELSTWIKKYQ